MQQRFSLIYVLPNLFTASSAFIGVLSVIAASKGEFEKAAWLIFISLIFDALDGRIARLTRTTSNFGLEFDSLADVIAFGAAPAMLLYFYMGVDFGRYGTLVSALFVVLGAVRLARFNVMSSHTDPTVFVGLPIPTAAVFVGIWILMFERYAFLQNYGFVLEGFALMVAVLMVSNVRFASFKKIDMRKPYLKRTLILLIFGASLIYLYPVEGLALAITVYIGMGPVRTIRTILTRKRPKI